MPPRSCFKLRDFCLCCQKQEQRNSNSTNNLKKSYFHNTYESTAYRPRLFLSMGTMYWEFLELLKRISNEKQSGSEKATKPCGVSLKLTGGELKGGTGDGDGWTGTGTGGRGVCREQQRPHSQCVILSLHYSIVCVCRCMCVSHRHIGLNEKHKECERERTPQCPFVHFWFCTKTETMKDLTVKNLVLKWHITAAWCRFVYSDVSERTFSREH